MGLQGNYNLFSNLSRNIYIGAKTIELCGGWDKAAAAEIDNNNALSC